MIQPTEGNLSDHIQYRLERAQETLNDSYRMILGGCSPNSIVNRLYYACFYASVALLLSRHILTKSHAGVKSQLGQHFVKTGILDPELNRHYSELFNARITGDYDDFQSFCLEDIDLFYKDSQRFLQAVKSILS